MQSGPCCLLLGPCLFSMHAMRPQAARRHADEYCRKQLGYGASNMRFVEGHIEYLDAAGIADSSVRPANALPGQLLNINTQPSGAA